MSSLFSKYRPRTWDGLIGHNHVKRSIRLKLSKGQLGGCAYMITGPSGIGKTSIAHYRQALAIACQGGTADHPYDQSQWGDYACGTPCCIHGHACLLAGEPIRPLLKGAALTAGIDLLCRQTDPVISLAMPDSIVECVDITHAIQTLGLAGWSDARVAKAMSVVWGDNRLVQSLSATWDDAGWSDERIVETLDDEWTDDRVSKALDDARGRTGARN